MVLELYYNKQEHIVRDAAIEIFHWHIGMG